MENTDEKESAMKWLLPLFILILLVITGYWFCTKPPEPPKTEAPPANTNTANTNK
jgi:hypothetical protein